MNLSRLVLSAPHRSSGKTTLSIGICAALVDMGHKVQPFKKGPDFIDPMWLSAAAKRECRNLDFFMMGEENILGSFQTAATGSDVSIIEGNMGLYDTVEVDGKGSTAHMAKLLKAPIILIVDASKMTNSIAPLLLGFQKFDPEVSIAGVILNKVANARHESKLKEAIKQHSDVEVIGSIPKLPAIEIVQRHLGLRPAKEEDQVSTVIEAIRDIVKAYVDLGHLVRIAGTSLSLPKIAMPQAKKSPLRVKLGVAKDKAFTFYYPENLESLRMAGAELVYFSPISDNELPDVDGLYIGGGFPEVFMDELEENKAIRDQIRVAVENGMPVYAECGGLMYLSRSISWNNRTRDMVGALPCDIIMYDKPKGHGYTILETTGNSWITSESEIRGHEFHYSEAINIGNINFAYKVLRGKGVNGKDDGMIYKNALASYTHLHSLAIPEWAEQYVSFLAQKSL